MLLLWGLSAAAGGLFLHILNLAPGWVAGIGGLLGVVSRLLWSLPLRGVDELAAGQYLDKRFHLAERMSSVAGLKDTRSRFRTALLADTKIALATTSGQKVFPRLLPTQAQYLAAPCGVIAVLLLLGVGDAPHPLRETAPAAVIGKGTVTAGDTAKNLAGKTSSRPKDLLTALQKATARAKKTGSPQDRAEVARLVAELKRSLKQLGRGAGFAANKNSNAKKRGNEAGDTDDRQGTGKRARLLRGTVARAEAFIGNPNHESVEAKRFQEDAPDWTAYTVLAGRIPNRYRVGVRAYLNALTRQGK